MTETICSVKDKAKVTAQPKLSATTRATQITKNNERQKKIMSASWSKTFDCWAVFWAT